MPIPATVGEYVTGAELVAMLKLGAGELERADEVAAVANAMVFDLVGQAGADLWLADGPASPRWSTAKEAALTIATDLWRRPKAPGGVFQVADYVGRLALDPATPAMALIGSLRRTWPIA